MSASLVGRDSGFEIHLIRVRVDIGKQRVLKPGCRQTIHCPRSNRQAGKTAVSDQQWTADANLGASLGKFGNPAGAKADRRRIGPVSIQVHHVTFFR